MKKRQLWPDEYLTHLTKVVGAIAAHGHAVIAGRGAGYILPSEICLRLLIVAPMDVRVSNVMYAYDVTYKEAEKRIIETEKDWMAFIKLLSLCRGQIMEFAPLFICFINNQTHGENLELVRPEKCGRLKRLFQILFTAPLFPVEEFLPEGAPRSSLKQHLDLP